MSIVKTKSAKKLSLSEATSLTWIITNQTDIEVVVISHAMDSDTTHQFYEQSLTSLQTTDGQKSIKAGADATINLDAKDYNIIIARADNLFPVKTINLAYNAETQSFPEERIIPADATNLRLAEMFKKYVAAFPTSAMATEWQSVLSANDPVRATAFFAKYTDYASLTIDAIVIVDAYYDVFPFAWTDYKNSKTYTLYTSNGTINKKVGTVTLNNACSVPQTADKTVPGFTAVCVVSGISKRLTYSNGQFMDDPSSDNPGICLQGLFVLKSQLTQKDANNEIISKLSGTVAGNSVLGYEENNTDSNSTLDKLMPPKTLAGWLEFGGILIAGMIAIVILAKLLKKMTDVIRNKGELSLEELQQIQEEFRRQQAELMKTDQRYLDRLKERQAPKLPNKFSDHSALVNNQAIKVSYEADLGHLNEIWDLQSQCLKTALKYGTNSTLEEIVGSLGKIKEWLQTNPDASAVAQTLDKVTTDFKTNSDRLAKEWKSIRNKQSLDMIDVDRALRAVADITQQMKENEKLREDWKEGEIPEDIIAD